MILAFINGRFYIIMIRCNLCQMEFKKMPLDDKFLHKQLRQHERFHLHCAAEKRNTTEGVVLWEINPND